MNPPTQPQSKRSMLSLWILIAMFALPMVAALFFYYNPQYLPAGRSNRGELIHPPRPVASLEFRTPDQASFRLEELGANWTMVAVADGACGQPCRDQLHDFQQIRLALAENRYRVGRLLILTEPTPGGADGVATDYPDTRVVTAEGAQLAALQQNFGDGTPDSIRDIRFLVDPMGNVMMRYAPQAPANDLLQDLEKLFKASKNWIKGAQYGHR
jgi:hypothetical protein